MAFHDDMPKGFVKHVVRRANLAARATTSATQSLASGATKAGSADPKKTSYIAEQTSSLEAPVVAIILGGFLGTFLLFVLIGITCKFVNRPRADPRPQNHPKAMFQPSAAGYGSAAAALGANYRGNESMHDVSNPKAGLLDSAQPMGRGGRYEEADSSLGSSNGYGNGTPGPNGGFGMIPSNSAGSFSGDDSHRFGAPRNGHARGASSGIELPGPAASAAFRRNVSGSHPPLHATGDDSYDAPHSANALIPASSVMPDGSGFTPGQIFDHNAINGGAPQGPSEMREARNSYLAGPPAGVLPRRASLAQHNPQQRSFARGPPPATSKNRRSRYGQPHLGSSNDTAASRRSRIDSIGPGTYRKSMFLQQDQDAMPGSEYAGGSNMRRTTSNNTDRAGAGAPRQLRRVDSVGKGDARRTSRFQANNRTSRMHSNMMADDHDALSPTSPTGYRDGLPATGGDYLSAAEGMGWSGGRRSPYGGSSNGSTSPLGPLGPHDPMAQQPGGGVRMMPYGAGFGAPMPRPAMATTQMSSPSSFAPAAPLGAGLGRGMEASSHAAARQIL
jgi:hypothetical protein